MPDLLELTDMVIANTVGPAYPGQPFNPKGLEHLSMLRSMIEESGRDIELAVDGNVRLERLLDLYNRGARHFVCGTSSIFIPDTDLCSNLDDLRRELASIADDHVSL
jgi:ribulose-phosphate 3-epimerase